MCDQQQQMAGVDAQQQMHVHGYFATHKQHMYKHNMHILHSTPSTGDRIQHCLLMMTTRPTWCGDVVAALPWPNLMMICYQ